MALLALLGIGEAPPGAQPPGLAPVAGLSLLERQVRQLRLAGIRDIRVLAPACPEPLAARLARMDGVGIFPTAEALARGLAEAQGLVMVVAAGLLVDQRILAAVIARAPRPCQAVFAAPAPAAAGDGGAAGPAGAAAAGAPPAGAMRLDGAAFNAGVMLLPSGLVRRTAAELGDWELFATLARAAAGAGVPRLLVETLPTYVPSLRRHQPMLWAMPRGAGALAEATGAVIAAAQKGCLDWPARVLHPPVENALVRLLLPTRVTPNTVTLVTAALGLLAVVAFATGRPWAGLVLVLLIGPLDGVDGKLARCKVAFSRWGELEHVLDKLLESAWYLALGGWLAGTGAGLAAWLAAGGIVVFALAEATQGEFFRRFTGRQLDDWGPFERRWRLVAGRRNTFFWSLLPFAVFDLWFEGLLAILAYAAVTFAVGQWRFLLRLGELGRAVSPEIADSFAATTYPFLPRAKGASSRNASEPAGPAGVPARSSDAGGKVEKARPAQAREAG